MLVDVHIVISFPDGVIEDRLLRQDCLAWEQLGSEPVLPTVTPGFAGEIVRKRLPVPRFVMNPAEHAVTGIETWVWYGDDGRLTLVPVDHDGDASTAPRWGATVTATDEGGVNTVTASAWISEFRWEMGDGSVVRSAVPGSQESPAGTHGYVATDPENVVRAAVTWQGTYTASNASVSTSGVLPPITIEGAWEPYPVFQIRSVPAPAPSG